MKIIGRKKEIETLNQLLKSKRPEFVCVYGRRRVGKTYLIKNFFGEKFSFYTTGIKNLSNRSQLSNFKKQLSEYGYNQKGQFKNWIDAFSGLINLLESKNVYRTSNNKRVVFIDETPWMDAAKSDFKAGLDYFWNSWGSTKEDLIIIVCGSATSWIINNLLKDTGGFYNRITKQIKLMPFSVNEVNELLLENEVHFSKREVIESFMIFGGVPFYLNSLNPSLSLAQNIEELFFSENGELKNESSLLLSSLFKHHEKHQLVLEVLNKRQIGLSKKEIKEETGIDVNRYLNTTLEELEQCGFIRSYTDYKTRKNNTIYQLIDPLILFSFYIQRNAISSWLNSVGTPKYYAWAGHSFEIFCLNHISLIKEKLGISGLVTNEYSYTSRNITKGTQIDLLIDRRDNVINLCEMKFSTTEFEITKDYENQLLNKIEVFRNNTKTKKTVSLTFITVNGLINNSYSHIVNQSLVVSNWLK